MKAGDSVIYDCLASQSSPLPRCSFHQGHWGVSRRLFPLSAAEQAPGLLRNWAMSSRFVPRIASKVAFSTAGFPAWARLNVFELRRLIQNCSFDILLGVSKISPRHRVWLAVTSALECVTHVSGCEVMQRRQDSGHIGFRSNHYHPFTLQLWASYLISLETSFSSSVNKRVTPLHWFIGTIKCLLTHMGCLVSLLVRMRMAIRIMQYRHAMPLTTALLLMFLPWRPNEQWGWRQGPSRKQNTCSCDTLFQNDLMEGLLKDMVLGTNKGGRRIQQPGKWGPPHAWWGRGESSVSEALWAMGWGGGGGRGWGGGFPAKAVLTQDCRPLQTAALRQEGAASLFSLCLILLVSPPLEASDQKPRGKEPIDTHGCQPPPGAQRRRENGSENRGWRTTSADKEKRRSLLIIISKTKFSPLALNRKVLPQFRMCWNVPSFL